MKDYISIADLEDREEKMNMEEEQLVRVMQAQEILNRTLEEGQIFSGTVQFAPCIIHEGKPYLGNISSFGVSKEYGFWIDVSLDKEPEGLYTFTVPLELYVGSELYYTFRELGIINKRREADLEKLDGKRVKVTLRREADGQFEIETIAPDDLYEETFTEDDFMEWPENIE
ncbi:MAG: hypothetical protein HFI75_10445 [Lachnospiraceae bacterium]|nr:hypothetical protein [Lachnospiraceae bacterium]